jgi:quinol monooxygenase YgiN
MFVVVVDVRVKPEHREQFIQATLANARGARTEPGNMRFDVSQADDDPNRFALYEVYRGKSDLEAHQKTPHYLAWREAVKDWMAAPRTSVKLESLFPEQEAQW